MREFLEAFDDLRDAVLDWTKPVVVPVLDWLERRLGS